MMYFSDNSRVIKVAVGWIYSNSKKKEVVPVEGVVLISHFGSKTFDIEKV